MLYWTHAETPLGTFHLSCNNHGLSSILLPGQETSGLDENPVKKGAAPEFLAMAAQQIREYCAGQRIIFDLPLSPQGTYFQRLVWTIISTIPYGRTMSYGEIAEELGSKNKARAVGGAANANPLPLIIPCHRVVGSNGSLTGYAGGLQLKEKLLNLERNTPRNG